MTPRIIARCLMPFLALGDSRPKTVAAMRAAQDRTLHQIVDRLAHLPVGRQFGLDQLPPGPERMEAFRDQIPVTRYADYADLLFRVTAGEADVLFPGRALALAQTSGTTSQHAVGERYIPQSRALLDHHARGGAAALTRLFAATGHRLLDGQLLMLGGSTDLVPNAHGIPVGDLSGIIVARIPRFLRSFYEPGPAIALIDDWETKLARIAERCAHRDVRLVSGIPSWCLMLFARICQQRGVPHLRTAWPDLDGFIHGGHGIAPVLPSLREHLRADLWMMEVYPASEAFIAVGSRPWRLDEDGPPPLELLCDHGVVLEFAPEDGSQPVGPEALVEDRIYRVLLTTPGGLVRYELGDLVQGCGPGQVRVAGRIRTRLSSFGEHVEAAHLDAALAAACRATAAEVAHYHVAPLAPGPGHPTGAHEWLVEFVRRPVDLAVFAAAIDQHLRSQVIDYRAHRDGRQLAGPRVVLMPAGTFNAWLAGQGRLGGQHKVPQAWADHSIADALIATARNANNSAG